MARLSPAQADTAAVAFGSDRFALELYAALRPAEGNLLFSPLGLSTAMALTSAGAAEETASQIVEAMRFMIDGERLHSGYGRLIEQLPPAVRIANGLWVQRGAPILPEFAALLNACYQGSLGEPDFAGAPEETRREIDRWIAQHTHERSARRLQPTTVDASTRFLLANAVRFKAAWESAFDLGRTQPEAFRLDDGRTVSIPTMRQVEDFRYLATDRFEAVELPFARADLGMFLFLPNEETPLATLERTLSWRDLTGWIDQMHRRTIDLTLPRFSIASRYDLVDVLRSLGMTDAFDPERADFSGINGRRDLFLGGVLQDARIDVGEPGAEAASAATRRWSLSDPSDAPVTVRADRPFLFVIRDNRTGVILFMGRLTDPTA